MYLNNEYISYVQRTKSIQNKDSKPTINVLRQTCEWHISAKKRFAFDTVFQVISDYVVEPFQIVFPIALLFSSHD